LQLDGAQKIKKREERPSKTAKNPWRMIANFYPKNREKHMQARLLLLGTRTRECGGGKHHKQQLVRQKT